MGQFKITDPQTGKSVVVSGDSAPTEQEAAQIFKDAGLDSYAAAFGSDAPNPASVIDAVRSVPGGLAQGVSALGGLPRDVNDLLYSGAAAVGEKLSPGMGEKITELGRQTPAGQLPGSGELNQTISEPFGGYYKPQTIAGEYAQTISSFAPNALAPGGIAARAFRAIVPGAASETAGQLTEGTPYEPYARAAGALAGGVGQGLSEVAISARRNPVPTRPELRAQKQAAYQAADQAGVLISPQSFQQFATNAGSNLTRNNVVQADIHPETLAALRILQEEAASGIPISLSRADAIRQAIKTAVQRASGQNGSAGDARLARQVQASLDDYLDNLAPQDTIAGNPSAAVPILREARGLAQREFKSEQIQELIDLAQNQASTNYSASGLEQALRAQFKNFNATLIKDESLARSFTREERAAIEQVARGGPIGNVLRYFGKLAPTGVVSGGAGVGLGAYAGGLMGGPIGGAIGSAAVPAFGLASRQGATFATNRNAMLAEQLMRRGPIPGQQPLQSPSASTSAIANLLLSQARP